MSKKHKGKFLLSSSYSADECKMMAAAIDCFWFDVTELETVHLSGQKLSALTSANAKMSKMTFHDNTTDASPLSINELCMAAEALFYVANGLKSGELDSGVLPADICDADRLISLAQRIKSDFDGSSAMP